MVNTIWKENFLIMCSKLCLNARDSGHFAQLLLICRNYSLQTLCGAPHNVCHEAGGERGIAMKLFHTALVLGKGGFGTQLGEMLAEAGGYSRILYLDDQAPDAAGKLADYLDPTIRERCTAAFVGLGNNELRLQWLQKLVAAGYQTPVFEHPAAEVCSSAALGAGTVVLPFAFVGAGTKVGAGCIINAGAIVDHNAVLEDGVHAAPRATIKAGATVERCMKVDSGEITRSPWEK